MKQCVSLRTSICLLVTINIIRCGSVDVFRQPNNFFASHGSSVSIDQSRSKRQANVYLTGGYQTLIGPRRPEPYCAGRRDAKTGRFLPCCAGREDACKVPFHDTSCYCDDFCHRSQSTDCCPDYSDYCFRVGFETTTPRPPRTFSPTTTSVQRTSTTAVGMPTVTPTSRAQASQSTHSVPDEAQKVCYSEGIGYRLGEGIKQNCNECVCKRVVNGYNAFVCENDVCLVQENLINVINQGQYGWTASNYSFFWGLSLSRGVRYRLGTKRTPQVVRNMTAITVNVNGDLPDSFNAREKWPEYILPPRDQGNCGSSWAFSTTSVASDRLAIQSMGKLKPDLSPQHLLSCRRRLNRKSCRKERVDKAWWFLRRKGAVSSLCYPFVGKRKGKKRCRLSRVNKRCPSSGEKKVLYKMGPPYRIASNENDIMMELKTNGPVQAIMKVTPDFFLYKSGIYSAPPFQIDGIKGLLKKSYHSVKIIGWGVETVQGVSLKYWIVQNSWGTNWGESGYFRIARGINASEIESIILGVWPRITMKL